MKVFKFYDDFAGYRSLLAGGDLHPDDPLCASAEDGEEFVRLTAHQSALAALREELAKWQGIAGRRTAERTEFMNERDDLQRRLAAAEQRNAELVELLRDIYNQNELSGFDEQRILEALKPTEPGAYQSREIGESDWADCSKEEYDRCGKDPHMDTRIKPTKSGASGEGTTITIEAYHHE